MQLEVSGYPPINLTQSIGNLVLMETQLGFRKNHSTMVGTNRLEDFRRLSVGTF